MISMNWEGIKNSIYFEDGSLRDIIVLDWSIEDWKKWVDLVNRKYSIEFYHGQTQELLNSINFQILKQYWEGKSDLVNHATICLNQLIIKCHFFDDKEFENDIQPREFTSITDHLNLIDYLVDISKLNGKPVFLTEENSKDRVLLEVNREKVKYHA